MAYINIPSRLLTWHSVEAPLHLPPGGPPTPAKQYKRLDITAEIARIKSMYANPDKKFANFLIIGDYGEGKTFGMRNAPGPVLIHSFDNGGSDCLKDYEDEGHIIVDRRFEGDNAVNPTAYRNWTREFRHLQRGGAFEQIGTYVIDSWTTFSGAVMYEILKARNRKPNENLDLGKDPDIVPELSDYNLHQKVLSQILADICALPCHTVILAHALINEDKTTGKTYASVMMDGKKFAQMVPSLFSEVYYADSKPAGPGKREYYYRTVPKGIFKARSRLSRNGILGQEEPQNLREILKKAGFSYGDVVVAGE